MHLDVRMLADDRPGRTGMVQVDVGEEQVPHVGELDPALPQAGFERGERRRRAAVEHRRPVARLDEVRADHALDALVMEVDRRDRGAHAPAAAVERKNASSRSSIRSSADSIPTLSRIRFRGAANGASAVEACVIRAGCSMRLSTPPSDSASWKSFVRPTISTASSSDPTRIEIMPPKSRIWRAAIWWPGWVGSPG